MALYQQTSPFKHVYVDRLIRGNTVVYWELEADFNDTSPWTFALQVSKSGNDSWTTVTSVTDTFYAEDESRREYGGIHEIFYRVKLTTADSQVYYSAPSRLPPGWTDQDLKWAEEIKRKEELVSSPGKMGLNFWILIRKTFGTTCSSCVDSISGETLTSKCTTCYGTGFEGGYFRPYKTQGIIIGQGSAISQGPLGTGFSSRIGLRYCPFPLVKERDVIVLSGLDERLFVEKIESVAALKGIPIIQHLELSAAPTTDVVYELNWQPTGGATGWYSPTGATASDWN